jgi:programmed cell death protein 4
MISTASNATVGPRSPTGKRHGRSTRQEVIRGQPKKQGHGGWGKVGEEMKGEKYALTIDDPNFDDEDEFVEGVPEFVGRRRRHSSVTFEVTTPRISPHDLEETCNVLLREYLESGDSSDFIKSMKRMNLSDSNMDEILVYAVSMSFDRKDRERELCSGLLCALTQDHLLGADAIHKGFNTLLCRIDDLILDCPAAPTFLAKFLARAVADDCLAPSFLKQRDGLGQTSISILDKAASLMSSPHALVRLDTVWGVGGGTKPVNVLEAKITMLLKEYLSSKEIAEAERCLVALDVPHFHHEAIFQLIFNALETPTMRIPLVNLLQHLTKTNIVTPHMVNMGFQRVYKDIKDIQLDIPLAFMSLEDFVFKAFTENCISEKLYRECPKIARKRYASQGDGQGGAMKK